MDLSAPVATSKDEFCEVWCMLVGVLAAPMTEKRPVPGDKGSGEAPSPAPAGAEAEAEGVDLVAPEIPAIAPEGPLVQEAEHHANVDPARQV